MAKKVKQIDVIKEKLELYLSNPKLIMESKGWTAKQYNEEVKKLQEVVEASNRGKRSKRKGGTYERTIAKKFKDALGVELSRTPQSGGFAKNSDKAEEFRGDIVSLDSAIDFKLHIECKNHKSWSLPAWIRQAEEDCPKGKVPVVIYHRERKLENGTTGKVIQQVGDYISIPLTDFLDIVDKSKIVVAKKVTKKSRRMKKK